VKPSDVLREDPKTTSFVRDFWGRGERESFAQVLKDSMVGRARRDRGWGRGFREEESWGGEPGWWNQGFPSMHSDFPPPQF
jgi:hypothetical protein